VYISIIVLTCAWYPVVDVMMSVARRGGMLFVCAFPRSHSYVQRENEPQHLTGHLPNDHKTHNDAREYIDEPWHMRAPPLHTFIS
jgi:hypothetical protein